MTEGLDFTDKSDDFLSQFMADSQPVEGQVGQGFYIDKKGEGITWHQVEPVRDRDEATVADSSAIEDANKTVTETEAVVAGSDPVEPIEAATTTEPNQTETLDTPEEKAKQTFAEKFINPIKSFLADTATEAGDALTRLREAAQSMSYSSDIWDTYIAEASGKPIEHIGGIPLPKEYPPIKKKASEIIIAGHMGFGERALPSHDRSGEGLQTVANTLSGLERGIQAGANLLEVDLTLTSDGEVVLYHKMPGQKETMTAEEFLARKPESMTLAETVTWLRAQPESVQIFLEPKSDIPLTTIVEQVKAAIPTTTPDGQPVDIQAELAKTLKRLCIYAYRASDMIKNKSGKEILRQKKELGLPVDQLKMFYITNGILTKEAVTKILDENEGIYAFEQGMMPWGKVGEGVPDLLKKITGLMSKSSIEEMIDYVHSRGVKIITGTANQPAAIHELMAMGYDGIVPDNPVDFAMAGIQIEADVPAAQLVETVPTSMGERLSVANTAAESRRTEAEQVKTERADRWETRRQAVKRLLGLMRVPTAT